MLVPRNEIVHPRDNPTGDAVFVGLEHIEPNTGSRIGQLDIRLDELTGRKARFGPGDIVYGYLRPYLNKVWLANFDGYCSVDQYVFGVRPIAEPAYVAWFMRSPQYLARAPIDVSPGQLPRIRTYEVLSVTLPLPPLDEQRRIASRLAKVLVLVDRATSMASTQRAALHAFVRSQLAHLARDQASPWPSTELGAAATTRPSPSTSTDGEATVLAVTSGCLTPLGFSAAGLRSNRMRPDDARTGTIEPGEVLVSRSNTAESVGRAALYVGEPRDVTATDLVFRVVPEQSTFDPAYVAWYLAGLQSVGYWRRRSSGASSTMSKITKSQLMSTPIPVPPLALQRRLADTLIKNLRSAEGVANAVDAQRQALTALSGAVLRQVFGGD